MGVATCNLNYLVNGTVSASYSNASASASVISNYVSEYTGTLASTLTSNTITLPPYAELELYISGFLVSDLIDMGYLSNPVTTSTLNNLTLTSNDLYELIVEFGIYPIELTNYQEPYSSFTVDVISEFDDSLYYFVTLTTDGENTRVIHHATSATSMSTEVTTEIITD